MKLYDTKVAPNPRRARIFIREKGLDIPSVEVSIRDGENLSAEYRAKNRFGLVPTLELDDGTCIDEVPAICGYLESLHPDPPLLGRSPIEKARVQSWERHMENQGMACIGETFRNSAPPFATRGLPGRDGDAAIPALVDRGKRGVDMFYSTLERRLSESPFVACDAYTLADITAFCAVDFASAVGMGIPDGNTKTRAWYEKVSARPATQV